MHITLNNGKTVEITFEQYDNMTEDQYRDFMDSEYGEDIQDPFYNFRPRRDVSFGTEDDEFSFDE